MAVTIGVDVLVPPVQGLDVVAADVLEVDHRSEAWLAEAIG